MCSQAYTSIGKWFCVFRHKGFECHRLSKDRPINIYPCYNSNPFLEINAESETSSVFLIFTKFDPHLKIFSIL
jgi:hypothetical protein